MPRFTVKLKDNNTNIEYYLMWSTIVDAPITKGMLREEYIEWYKNENGELGLEEWLKGKRNFAEIEDFLDYNRAGENEEHLNKQEIFDLYCVKYRE